MRAIRFVLAILGVLVTQDALAVQLQLMVQGLDNPLYVTHAGDGSGRLFIVEQPGRIKVLQPGATTPTVFLDITSLVGFVGERGLLGLAFHPDYPTNGFFYLHYTDNGGDVIVARYQVSANPNVANAGSALILTTIEHSQFGNHNGGMVEFGPDGHLYVGVGDGGSGNDPNNQAQSLGTLLGKILRLNVDIAAPYVPGNNPFVGLPGARGEIYAFGFRNPFRFSFDRGTGLLFVGDVGEGEREEIDIITAGGNFGWRVFEGTRCTGLGPAACGPQFIPPIAEYTHAGGRCSVIGGYAYRGTAGTLPVGTYAFGDLCTGEIFILQNGAIQVLFNTTLGISSFGEDAAGELYVVGLGGTVHRLAAGQGGAFTGGVFVAAGNLPGSGTILTAPGPGGHPHARIFRPDGSPETTSVFAFSVPFGGGARVAVGDVNGDLVDDIIVGAGPGGGPHVRILSGVDPAVELASFFAFAPSFLGGVFVAAGDVNGDGRADVIVSADAGGGPHVRVFSGANPTVELASFFTYSPFFSGGVRVAAADVNNDGHADIITGAGPGGGPHVRVFSGAALPGLVELASFLAFDPRFLGGVFVAGGPLNGDGNADLVVGAGAGGGPHVRVFSGANPAVELASFFAYVPAFTGGVRVAVGNVSGGAALEIVTGAGQGGGPHVRTFTAGGGALPTSFLAY